MGVVAREPCREVGLVALCRGRGLTVAAQGERAFGRPHVAVLLTDVASLGLDGAGAVAEASSHGTSVVVLEEGPDEALVRLLRAGARGLVPRVVDAEALEAIVRRVAAGDLVLGSFGPERLLAIEAPGPRLSARELDVVRLAAQGHTNAAIATMLYVSVETVKTLLKRAKEKLDTRDRTHTVYRAFTLGLL